MKPKYIIGGNFIKNKTLWIRSTDKYEYGYDADWELLFTTKQEACTVAYMVARSFYLYHSLKVPVPVLFSKMGSCADEGTADEMLGYMKKFKNYEKYLSLYESKWLGV